MISSGDKIVASHIFFISPGENWCEVTKLICILLRASFADMQNSAWSANVIIESESAVTSFRKKVYHFRGLLILRCDAYSSTIF